MVESYVPLDQWTFKCNQYNKNHLLCWCVCKWCYLMFNIHKMRGTDCRYLLPSLQQKMSLYFPMLVSQVFMDFWFLIISRVILLKNKDYACVMPIYVLLPTFYVDFSWNIVVCWQYFKDYTHKLMDCNCWKTRQWFLLFVHWIFYFDFPCTSHVFVITFP
jgi:hypothetical protein